MTQPLSCRIAVVGGGIAGLAAAWFLTQRAAGRVEVIVLESSPQLGGKLRVSEVAGLPVDEGAEAFLARRPEAIELARAVGLGADLVAPATIAAAVWTRGTVRPLPKGHIMGIPTDLRALAAAGVLSPGALLRLPLDHVLPRTEVSEDVSVGRYVAARLGREVVDRLVEPLLGGVYAGHADLLSLDATIPQLARVAREERSLLTGARRLVADAGQTPAGPVFNTVAGGLGRLPEALAGALAATGAAHLRTGATVRELHRTGTGWRLVLGPTRAPEALEVDGVILAVPAGAASRLLADAVPGAAAELGGIDYASVAVITLAYPRSAFPRPLTGSGFLVPPVDGRLVKAATYASVKWGWLGEADPDTVIVRLSVGRYGEEQDLQRDDAELAELAHADLVRAVGVQGRPIDHRVTRWGGALPQYAVGHRARVARIQAAVAAVPGLAVAGAAYDGVGIPVCVASGRAAAERVLAALLPKARSA
ncbi:protoporphyrinogen oxidase [Carbonactinospora thermoautotrophica]|uniref:protoporphyrinogen oxidase n=1 Tax=Carbonactinospora thermoautotrophica TaxID=1469144 RepID=UPI002270BDD3|nr:protoporphyrinogen oxidase [Carbonactinospora thermoautotrophica]MCX9190693.1 protoporphyrinogen oxidase [Carbonactinospora thermoautotrophica]